MSKRRRTRKAGKRYSKHSRRNPDNGKAKPPERERPKSRGRYEVASLYDELQDPCSGRRALFYLEAMALANAHNKRLVRQIEAMRAELDERAGVTTIKATDPTEVSPTIPEGMGGITTRWPGDDP